MFPIAVLIRGSNVFGEGQTPGSDVDLYVPYIADSAQIFRGGPIPPTDLKDGSLDYEHVEIGTVVRNLVSGDSKTLVSLLSPGTLSQSYWYIYLKTILQQDLSMAFAEPLMEYIKSIADTTDPDDPDQGVYTKVARYINFGMGYYKDKKLTYEVVVPPKGGFNKKWYTTSIKALKSAIDDAEDQEVEGKEGQMVKVYDHNKLSMDLVQWLVMTRSQVFKIEDQIFT